MSIYAHTVYRPRYWAIPERQSSRKDEQTNRIWQIVGSILAAIGMLLSATVTIAIPIAVGIAIGAFYFYRKNRETPLQPAIVPELPQNNQSVPPPYVAPLQNPPSDAPPPYSEEIAPLSHDEVRKIINRQRTAIRETWFRILCNTPQETKAFIEYLKQNKAVNNIATYQEIHDGSYHAVEFTLLAAAKQNKCAMDIYCSLAPSNSLSAF